MALEKLTISDKVEVLNLAAGYPVIQVRVATIITDDGVEISRNFHRHVLTPDADISQESDEVKRIATAVFTAAAKAKYAEVTADPAIAAAVVED
jgi:hypothetical protein